MFLESKFIPGQCFQKVWTRTFFLNNIFITYKNANLLVLLPVLKNW